MHDRHRNLVVAATGTGKTVVAALDYRRLGGGEKSLLFVAHRRELLEQARRTYREVLGDGTFGELLVGGRAPKPRGNTSSPRCSRCREVDLPAFDVAVIDEFHHAEAPSYRALLERLAGRRTPRADRDSRPRRRRRRPRVLRRPGRRRDRPRGSPRTGPALSVPLLRDRRQHRPDGGRMEARLLRRRRPRPPLHRQRRAHPDRPQRPATTASPMLGGCAPSASASRSRTPSTWREKFTTAGIPARAVHGETPADERASAAAALRRARGRVPVHRRPLQRGRRPPVRRHRAVPAAHPERDDLPAAARPRACGARTDKAVLTVLDFIGQHRREFRFDVRYRALTGSSRSRLVDDIEQGFPFLPSGCRLILDRVAQEVVLENVKQGIEGRSEGAGATTSARTATCRLVRYLEESGHELADIYGRAAGELDGAAARCRLPDDGPRVRGRTNCCGGSGAWCTSTTRACADLHASDVAGGAGLAVAVAERAGDGAHARLHDLAGPRWPRLDRGGAEDPARAPGCSSRRQRP